LIPMVLYLKTWDWIFENEIYSYITEGIGEDILPLNVDFLWLMGLLK
jgi:hypothetical protein